MITKENFFTYLWWGSCGAVLLLLLSPLVLVLFGAITATDFAFYLQQIVSGIANGCVYALVALGLVLIYKATETINFAQGELLMLGAFFGFSAVMLWGLPWWLGLLFALVTSAVAGVLVERAVIRPLVGEPAFTIVMATLGVGFLLRAIVGMTPGWGTDTFTIDTPWKDEVFRLGGESYGAFISQEDSLVIGVTILLCFLLYLFFQKTKVGLAMQAVSENQLAAYYMGIPVGLIFTMIWALSSASAGLAGLLIAPIAFVHTNMGFLVFKAFAAAVVGGLNSLPGAVVGGLVIGISETLAGFYLPEGFKDTAAFILLLFVLFIRPEGIFGEGGQKKV